MECDTNETNVILWTDKVLKENLLLINKLMQHGRKNSDF